MKHLRECGFFLAATMMSAALAQGAPQNITPNASPDGVQIRLLVPESATFWLGDPVIIVLKVENDSENDFSFVSPSLERFRYRTASFQIMPPHESYFREVEAPGVYDGAMKIMSPPTTLPLVTLLPKEKAEFHFILDYDCPTISRCRWLFPVAGEYAIKAFLLAPKQSMKKANEIAANAPMRSLESEVLAIHIRKPTNTLDITAYGELTRLKYRYLLYAPDQFNPEKHGGALTEIEGFATKYPTSRYAYLAQFFVGYAQFIEGERKRDLVRMQRAYAKCRELVVKDSLPIAFQPKAEKLNARMLGTLPRKPVAK